MPPGHLYTARIDPRRRTHAVGLYTHVLDQHGIIYDQPIVLNERQAGPAIEGVVRYNDSIERVRLSLLAVDTHGYTNIGMAVAKGLGFNLCPRLRDLAERKLFLPRRLEAPEDLDQVLVRDVSLKAIRTGWDEYLRTVASVRSGRISAMCSCTVSAVLRTETRAPCRRPARTAGCERCSCATTSAIRNFAGRSTRS